MKMKIRDILSEIVAHKQVEVAEQKQMISLAQLRETVNALQEEEEKGALHHSMKLALAQSKTGIIAEFKRRSPSKGWIHEDADVVSITTAYERAGAAALSVLTDEHFFGGTLSDLRKARAGVNIPILRKEFIIDEYQLLQSYIVGADAVLLIAACLSRSQSEELVELAHELGLEVLFEVHSSDEFLQIPKRVDMIGVNNRNLGTFVTDVENSFHMASFLRENPLVQCNVKNPPLLVSESGLSTPETLCELRQVGFQGFLMGETFMKQAQPGEALAAFISQIESV